MDPEETLFQDIASELTRDHPEVALGKMMSRPGITYKDKVFAFYRKKEMVFKLGKAYDPGAAGIDNYSLLNPFKNKPPMAAWFQIPFEYEKKWLELAEQAMRVVAAEVDGK